MTRPQSFRTTLTLFGVGKFCINTATRLVYAFLPALARGMGVPLDQFGTLVSVRWIAGATTPVVVAIAGREDRRQIGGVGLGLFVAGAFVTAATGAYVGALFGFVLMGVAAPVFNAATQASVADRVPYERRGRILGLLESTWSLAFLIGAPIAGWLIGVGGWTAPFWATGLGVALVLPMVLRGMVPGPVSVTDVPLSPSSGPAPDIAKVSGAPSRIRWDRSAVGFIVATVALVGSSELVFISYATWLEDAHGLGVEGLALVAVGIGLAELVAEGAVVGLTDRFGKRWAVALGLALSAFGYLTLATTPTLVVGVGGLILGIAGFEFALVSSIPLGTELQPQARIQFLSRFYVAQSVGRALTAVGGLALFRAWGISGVGVVAAAVAVAGAVVILTTVREHGGSGPVRPDGGKGQV